MWPFKKKYTYAVKWSYEPGFPAFADLVKAYDSADAWRRIRLQHGIAISLVSIEKVE